MSQPSLYDRLGGEAAIMAAVSLFYGKCMADARVAHFFADLDVGVLTKKQVAFMARAFGGPAALQGRDLTTAHAPLVRERGLDDGHFDAVGELLSETLEEMSVEAQLIAEVMAIVESTRGAVLGR